MNSKASLVTILIAMLLTNTFHAVNWQGMGSGMNNTVISEIWQNLETNLNAAILQGDSARTTLVNNISGRLNARWGKAWNVVLNFCRANYDTIFYGYAFNNQWMWYNGVPYASYQQKGLASLIIWKDYNCKDWKDISSFVDETSSFTTAQKTAIKAEIDKMTEDKITNDIWGAAYTMMKNLEQNALFSSGGYSVVMSQDGGSMNFGRVCRVGNSFYYSYRQLDNNPIIISASKGLFYLFQTR